MTIYGTQSIWGLTQYIYRYAYTQRTKRSSEGNTELRDNGS